MITLRDIRLMISTMKDKSWFTGKGGFFLLVGVVGLQFFTHHFTSTYLVGMITMIMMTDNEFHVKFIR